MPPELGLPPSVNLERGSSAAPLLSPMRWPGRLSYRGCLSSSPSNASYLILVNGREQANKGVGVVADAARIAKTLGRVLVEPAMASSRMRNPWNASDWAGSAFGDYWDLEPLCTFTPMLPLHVFQPPTSDILAKGELIWLKQAHGPTHATTRINIEGLGMLRSTWERDAVRNYFKAASQARYLVLDRVWKTGTVHPSSRANFNHSSLMDFPAAPAIVAKANTARKRMGKYACMQWRSEGCPAENITDCASKFNTAARKHLEHYNAATRTLLEHAEIKKTVLATDVIPNRSWTLRQWLANPRHKKHKRMYDIAQEVLLQDLNLTDSMGSIPASLSLSVDQGVKSIVEMQVCARAALLITCHGSAAVASKLFYLQKEARRIGSNCSFCSKGDSGFVERLLTSRHLYAKQTGSHLTTTVW